MVLYSLLSPISMVFIVIILGYYLGRIKILKVSLGLSGVLIVAVFVGWFLAVITPWKTIADIEEYQSYMKFFSTFGTALFVSTIGISTGSTLDLHNRKNVKAVLVGSLMVVSAFVTMRIISMIDKNITISKLLGSLCGALTTTPGLSAACELKNVASEEVVLGYGCTYIFGVIATVLFVQITTRKLTSVPQNSSQKELQVNQNTAALSGLIQIGCTVILGRIIGSVEILNFSLGNSGGMLCGGMIIGFIVKKTFQKNLLTTKELTPFRNLGLALFLVGNGIPAGMQFCGEFDIKIIIYGILMTLFPIAIGVILNKLFFKEGLTALIIAGGMTSTPAVAVLNTKYSNICLSTYASAYFGALLTVVILISYVI